MKILTHYDELFVYINLLSLKEVFKIVILRVLYFLLILLGDCN